MNFSQGAFRSKGVIQRQQVKSFSMPDDDKVSNELRELWEYNNMESQQVLLHTDS